MTFQMDGEGRAHRPAADIERQRRRYDPVSPGFFRRSGVDPQAVRAAQIVRHIEAEFGMSGAVRFALGDDRGQFLPARPGHPVADDAGPVELIARAGDQSIAAHQNRLSDAGRLWNHNELILPRLHRWILPRMPFGRRRQHRRTHRNGERDRPARPVRLGALLHVPVRKCQLSMQHLQDVHAGPAGRRNRKAREAVRCYRGDPPGEIVVVEQIPRIDERAPTDALCLDGDRRADRPAFWRDLHRHVDRESGLDKEAASLLQHYIVHEAEIRRNESRIEAPGLVGFQLRDLVGDRPILAAAVFRISNFPGAVDRAPDELELLSGGQTLRGHRQQCARRAMLRCDDQPADIATRWFTDHDLRAECRGKAGCGRRALRHERQQQ